MALGPTRPETPSPDKIWSQDKGRDHGLDKLRNCDQAALETSGAFASASDTTTHNKVNMIVAALQGLRFRRPCNRSGSRGNIPILHDRTDPTKDKSHDRFVLSSYQPFSS